MVLLVSGKPKITKVPYIKIDGLKSGIYRFQLRVFDSARNVSRGDIVTIKIGNARLPLPDVNFRDNFTNLNPVFPKFTIRL